MTDANAKRVSGKKKIPPTNITKSGMKGYVVGRRPGSVKTAFCCHKPK